MLMSLTIGMVIATKRSESKMATTKMKPVIMLIESRAAFTFCLNVRFFFDLGIEIKLMKRPNAPMASKIKTGIH